MKVILIMVLCLTTACTTTTQTANKKPCKPDTQTDKILDTAMAAFILSQGKGFYYPEENCE